MPPDSDENWRPLHPLSPLFRAGRFGVVALIFVVQQGVARAEPIFAAGGLAVLLLVTLVVGYVEWRMTGYRVVGDHIEHKAGVFQREHRRLPLARIEVVDVLQPALPRLLGMAELRVKSASSDDGEIRLQYLDDATAWALRDQLRVAKAITASPDDAMVVEPASGHTGSVVFEVDNRELFLGYLLARITLPLLFLVLVVIGALVFHEWTWLSGALPLLIAVVSIIANGLRTAESMYSFTLYEHPDGLFIHRGLFNKMTQRATLDRVQAVAIQEPFWWRRFGRCRLLVDIAGYRAVGAAEAEQTSILVPIARYETCVAVLHRVLPGLAFDDVELVGAPRSARWLDPFGWSFLRFGMNRICAVTRHGILRRFTVVVPHGKVQSWRLESGPWQRRLGVATLRLDTAGTHVVFGAAHRDRKDLEAALESSRAFTHE